MQPQQPYLPPTQTPTPSQQPGPGSNYDFIINPVKPPKRSLFAGGSSAGPSFALKLLLILGGLFIIFAILAVIMRSLNVHGSFDQPTMLSVAQDQDEILHLTTSGTQNSVAEQNLDFAETVQLSVTSEQTALNSYFKANNYKPKAKLIALKESASVDSTLTNAQAASNYDSVFSGVITNALNIYRSDLAAAYKVADPRGKAILKIDYNGANLLLTQLGSSDG